LRAFRQEKRQTEILDLCYSTLYSRIREARPLNGNFGKYKSWPIYRLSGYEIEFDAASRREGP
jgi:hypothetical protein